MNRREHRCTWSGVFIFFVGFKQDVTLVSDAFFLVQLFSHWPTRQLVPPLLILTVLLSLLPARSYETCFIGILFIFYRYYDDYDYFRCNPNFLLSNRASGIMYMHCVFKFYFQASSVLFCHSANELMQHLNWRLFWMDYINFFFIT